MWKVKSPGPEQIELERMFTFEALKIDGTNVGLLEFTAYQQVLFVDDVDSTLNFD